MKKIALVTGGSSGIGKATTLELLKYDCIVYELSRRDSTVPGVIHVYADITNEDDVRTAINTIINENGRIDILVNNAGFGISGAVEMTGSNEAHSQLEVNLFGMDRVTRAVIPSMRENGGGRIICLSSIAGIIPIPFQTWYSVSKAAVLSYVLALQNEVRPWHISICAVMPGDIATGFTSARKKSIVGDDVYGGRIAKSVAGMEHDEIHGMAPEQVAHVIVKYAMKKKSRPMVSVGIMYKGAAILAKLLPRRLSNWIVGKLYAA